MHWNWKSQVVVTRYTAENSVNYGAPRDTDHHELRQPLALEIWESVVKRLDPGSKITILTNGPLTTLAKIILLEQNTTSVIQVSWFWIYILWYQVFAPDKKKKRVHIPGNGSIQWGQCSLQDVYIVGGHISSNDKDKGNVFTIPSNEYAEFNMFLDPIAANTVFGSSLSITLIPLSIQQKVSSFSKILEGLRQRKKTPEAHFARRVLSRLYRLQQLHHRYHHMVIKLPNWQLPWIWYTLLGSLRNL